MRQFQKNERVQLSIEDLSHEGLGVGKIDGYTVFVKDTVIGDEVEVQMMKLKKTYGYARVVELIKPSSHRTTPHCQFARQCGGCQLQFMDYPTQLEFKKNKIINNLQRIGGFTDIPFEAMLGMEEPFFYRNKAQFPVGRDKQGNIITGFYAGRTHDIISNRSCCIGATINEEVLNCVMEYMQQENVEPYNEEKGTGLVRHILIRYGFTTKEIMVCLIINGNTIPAKEELIEKLLKIEGMTSITLNINKKKTNVILGEEIRLLWGQNFITDYIGDIKFQISPLSFYQVNPSQTKVLYEKAMEYANLQGNETVWDLYCGIGTISLFLTQKAKQVYGVEIVPQAIEDAKNNAKINDITNAEFFVGKAEEIVPEKYEKDNIHADVIVVDPPRKGCDEKLLQTMVQMNPDRIVYVSCDSATLARDLKYLSESGYELKNVCGVDQFGQTVHVETVVLMSRTSGNK